MKTKTFFPSDCAVMFN